MKIFIGWTIFLIVVTIIKLGWNGTEYLLWGFFSMMVYWLNSIYEAIKERNEENN